MRFFDNDDPSKNVSYFRIISKNPAEPTTARNWADGSKENKSSAITLEAADENSHMAGILKQ